MQVSIVPCLRDNYAYVLLAPGSKRAVVVDPGDAAPVAQFLQTQGLSLGVILATHHHLDHVGGVAALLELSPGTRVFAHESDRGRIVGQSESLADGEALEVEGLNFRALHVPGHTLGALSYYGEAAVFTGDTLFAAGCGRLFEGTPAQMYESLNQKLGALPEDTRVYCGHEYTRANLRFAAQVEPGNQNVAAKARQVAALRERGSPTVPSSLREEKATNPFLRCDSAEIIEYVSSALERDRSPIAVFGALRAAKDHF